MKRGAFTIFFMVSISVFFISILAFVNEVSKERIAENQEIRRVRSILYACDIFPHGVDESSLSPTSATDEIPWNEAGIVETMRSRTQWIRLPVTNEQKTHLGKSFLSVMDSADILVIYDESRNITGYGFDLKGKGLWGSISAFAVVSADLRRMIGIDFTEQVETPGLGARITESGFKYYFRGLTLDGFVDSSNDQPPVIMVGKKSKSNLEMPSNSVEAITGATQTCNGVLNMINTDLSFYLGLLRPNMSRLEALIP